MNSELMWKELERVNLSDDFWKSLDDNFSQSSCSHDHGQNEPHFHMAGNFSIAQEKINQAIKTVFDENFDAENQEHRDHLITLAAIQKAQDQLSGGNDFISQRTSEFNKYFKISDSLTGKNIAGETFAMPNARKYLVQRFKLGSTWAKADVIRESQESSLTKAGQLLDLGFKDATDPLVEVSSSIYKAAPSLAVAGLTLGTAHLILRSCGDQENANKLRDNIGASTEAAAFFVLVNGVLENLSHSFILAAPAIASVVAYDSAYPRLKPIYDYCMNSNIIEEETASISELNSEMLFEDVENNSSELESEDENKIDGSFENKDFNKTINLLKRAKSLVNEDDMWVGLKKNQLVYQDNTIEDDLKNGLEDFILELEENPNKLNELLQGSHKKTLRDSFEMLKAYTKLYDNRNPASGVSQFLNEFCDHFSRDAILLTEPSKEAKMAAFYCKSHGGLVSFEERIRESLPHMPTGQQVLLAATVIGGLYSASAIYKSVTGEEEVYTDYVTNFPDHLFEWLHLDQMYQNMGGGAEITESFKDFFAGFNLAENSTHLGIAVAPFAVYAQKGSKMFDGITHTPANYLAYAGELSNSYISATKKVVDSWFSKGHASSVAPEINNVEIERDDVDSIDLEIGSNLIHKSTQTDFPKDEKSDEEDVSPVYCMLSTSQTTNIGTPSTKPKKASHTKSTPLHQHGPNCKHL